MKRLLFYLIILIVGVITPSTACGQAKKDTKQPKFTQYELRNPQKITIYELKCDNAKILKCIDDFLREKKYAEWTGKYKDEHFLFAIKISESSKTGELIVSVAHTPISGVRKDNVRGYIQRGGKTFLAVIDWRPIYKKKSEQLLRKYLKSTGKNPKSVYYYPNIDRFDVDDSAFSEWYYIKP